eukprot:TRINITY_DN6720_c0_g1_i6.p1 TRINITY_DN6720_c0_g1~~TRINITY_DN6720_c0_g1_i6.p1  ORF type:complete len:282 (+),score=82.07 TRINITY_DN6720_c0_g1_i6:61-906(+)
MDPSVLYWPTVEPSSLHNKLRTGGVTKRRSSKAGDDRSNQQLRPIHMSVGPLSRAVGSAFIEIGGTTKVIASVYGPRQQSLQQQQTAPSERAILNCEVRFSTFANPPNQFEARNRFTARREEEIQLSKQLEDAISVSVMLEKYPKASIDVYVLIVEAGGGEFAASICAASLALAHAGIDLYDLVSAASVAVVRSEKNGDEEEKKVKVDEETLVDPDLAEISGSSLRATTAFMGAIQQVTHIDITGSAELDQIEKAFEVCTDAASMIYRIMQNTLFSAMKSS